MKMNNPIHVSRGSSRLKKMMFFAGLAIAGVLFYTQPFLTPSAQAQGGPPAPAAADAPAIDLTGYWTPAMHEDALERGGGSELGDYAGFALNEAGRLWALSYDPSRLTLRQHQCDAYVSGYQMRATGNFRMWEERDPHFQRLVAVHVWGQTTEGHRVIWMDGRPHPPAWAPHSFRGFSTGKFVGNALVAETTHMKQGWLRRNGTPQSDQATMVDYFVRHGDHLTNITVITDPVFLSEPEVRSNDYYRNIADHRNWLYACDDGEQITGRPADKVPNYLFGQQPFGNEFEKVYKLPLISGKSGAASVYPEFQAKMKTATDAEGLALLKPKPGVPNETSKAAAPSPADGQIHVLPLRNNVYLLVGDGGNVIAQTGDEGTLVVNTGAGKMADKLIDAIVKISSAPISFVVNTGYQPDYTGGNGKFVLAGRDLSLIGSFFSNQHPEAGSTATLIAHQNTQNYLNDLKYPEEALPTDTFLLERRRKFHNDDSMEMFWEPHSITDGESIVWFRRADVIATGDIFNTTQYPVIDLKRGGSVEGEIKALNDILNRTVYEHEEDGGTIVIPGHGYVCNEHEVLEYRDMMVIIRDRMREMMNKGASLADVKAARLTADYDTRYGQNSGPWTTEMFVDAVYNSLKTPLTASK
jgi:cyclase